MRTLVGLCICLLLMAGPAASDDKPKDEPKKPAREMTETERRMALSMARAWNQRVLALYREGKYREAAPVARQVLELRERALGPDHPDVATSLNNLAAMLEALGEYKQARPLYERALRIWEKASGPEHEDVGTGLNNLAALLRTLGEYEEARPLYERALAIWEKTYGPDDPNVARVLNNLAALFEAMGAYAEARPRYERALTIWERAHGKDHPSVGTALNNLGMLHYAAGAYEKARPLYERALRIFEIAFGREHRNVATCLDNLALALDALGDYEGAHPLYERALRIREKALGPEHTEVAMSLSNLGLLLETLGAYERARPLCERALAIWEKALGKEHPDVATGLNNVAAVLVAQGAYEEARPLYERALGIRRKANGEEHPEVATAMNNLAELLVFVGDHEQALALHQQALRIRTKALGPEHPSVAMSLNNLAALLVTLGAYAEARRLYERAIAIDEKVFGPKHPEVAADLRNLADLHMARGAYAEARPLYERALTIRQESLGAEHPSVAMSLHDLGRVLLKQGQHDQAASLLTRCLSVAEKQVRQGLTGLQASTRYGLLRSLRTYLASWLEVAPRIERSGVAEVLRFKGLIARAESGERRLARGADEEARARIGALKQAERRLAKLANAMPSLRDKRKKAAWQKAYADAASQREQLALALQRDLAPMRQKLERLQLSLADIQARLEADAVLLEYLRSDDTYLAWIIGRRGQPVRVELGDAEAIEEAAAEFAESAPESDDDGWRDAGKTLRALIFDPIAARLGKSVNRIHVCPDAALAAVPFGALPGAAPGRLVIDEYELSAVSMAQDLVPWPDAPAAGTGALLLGGVNYDEAAVGKDTAQTGRTFVDRPPPGRRFAYLAGTKAETEAIRDRIGSGSEVLSGKEATESRLRSQLAGKRVLHLATHGFVRDDLLRGLTRRRKERTWLGANMERKLAQGHDPMLLAGLALAGANPRAGGHGDDGILTALEASHLDLDGVELVVLSACQTALGKAESGEGVIGLVQGFQMAGSKRVIGSLWRVDDEATRALMVKFYELWSPQDGKGLAPAAALRKAQLHVRSQAKWAHPYYWAAWLPWGLP
ncbi:MAG: CHAT domain-containing protein [Planctomycetota bacterium]|nr:CHAT domain-containing protein [Planctomycetota bacterium]